MQDEELREARAKVDALQAEHTDVRDFAPLMGILEFLAQKGWASTQGDFLPSLAEYLGKALGVDCVFIDRLKEAGVVQSVALYAKGKLVPNVTYALRGTPCENVAGKTLCHYPAGVQRLFPQDEMLAQLGAESYLGIPLWDSRGQPIGVIGITDANPLPDPTLASSLLQVSAVRAAGELERLEYLETLRKSEAVLRESQIIAGLGSYVLDIPAGLWRSSDVLDKVFGIDSAYERSLEGWAALIHPNDRAMTVDYCRHEVLGQGRTFNREYRIIRHQDQAERWVHGLGKLEFGADGRPLTVHGTIQDITARKEAEERLRRQAALLDAANDAIYVCTLDHTVTYWNASAERLYGWPGAEALGRKITEFSNPDPAAFAAAHAALLTDGSWSGELTKTSKVGKEFVAFCRWTLLRDAQGRPPEILAIDTNITEQKQMEARFRQAQKMETVGRLAGGIAHDFNNLLTVISGTVDLALTDLREGDPLRAYLQDVRQAGERAAALTRQLLAFSRTQMMRLEVLNLSTLVADLQSVLQRMIGGDIELVVVPAKDGGRVMADPAQMEQVVMNLAVNARDAMSDGGTLTIETRDVDLDEAHAADYPFMRPGPHVTLAISDTGVGMDEATRARIFEPFFTTKEPGQGTGFGLSTVYGIVKQSGGSILVSSELGKGTTFTIYLPRVEEVAREIQPAPIAASLPGSETILLVEDEEAVRRLVTRILQAAGYTVLAASGGREALLLLERHAGPVPLMLTDVVMPGMSGRELAAQLEDVSPRMKVLYTSGYTDDAILRHGVLDKAAHFIAKPYTAAALTRKVREMLDS